MLNPLSPQRVETSSQAQRTAVEGLHSIPPFEPELEQTDFSDNETISIVSMRPFLSDYSTSTSFSRDTIHPEPVTRNGTETLARSTNGHTISMLNRDEGKQVASDRIVEKDYTDLQSALLTAARQEDDHDDVNHVIKLAKLDNIGGARSGTARNRALHYAAKLGNCDMIKILVNEGEYVDVKNENQMTPLHFAAILGRAAAASTLLDHGANVAATCPYALSSHITKAYFSGRLRDSSNSLPLAAFNGSFESLEPLLERGTPRTVVEERQGKTQWTPLMAAVRFNNESAVKVLLDRGANMGVKSADGSTLLHMAAAAGSVECLRMLLDHGADIEELDGFENTPLLVAVRYNKPAAVDILLDRGAAVSFEQGMASAVHMAAMYDSVDCLRVLLDRGAGTESLDSDKATPLIYAAQGRSELATKLLLERGARPRVKNRYGEKAIVFAYRNEAKEIMQMLQAAGSNKVSPIKKLFSTKHMT